MTIGQPSDIFLLAVLAARRSPDPPGERGRGRRLARDAAGHA